MPIHWLSFCQRFKVMDPRFIPSDDPWQKAFTMSLVTERPIWTHIFITVLWQPVTLRCKQTDTRFRISQDICTVVHTSLGYCQLSYKLLVVSRLSFRMKQPLTAVVGQPDRRASVTRLRMALLRTCNSWSPLFTSTALTQYKLINACEIFVTDSFSATSNSVTARMFKTHINIPRHFDDPCACTRRSIIPQRCSSKRDVKN